MAEKRAGNISAGQKEILIEFLNVHPELVSAKFSSSFSHKDAQTLWNEVSNTLNALPGAKKTWFQWRKAWHNMRTKVKGQKANINKNFNKTGGGPQQEINMTSVDNNIAKLIGSTVIYGDASIDESVVEFDFLSTESNNNESATCLTKNNTGIVDSSSTLISSIKKFPAPECSWNKCNKENEPSIANYLANSNIDVTSEYLNKEKDTNTNIILNKAKSPITKIAVTSGTKGRARSKSECFENTLLYTKNLSDNVQNDLELRQQYYHTKIQLMERDVIAKERIAAAIEKFCAISNRMDHQNYEDMVNLDETEQNT